VPGRAALSACLLVRVKTAATTKLGAWSGCAVGVRSGKNRLLCGGGNTHVGSCRMGRRKNRLLCGWGNTHVGSFCRKGPVHSVCLTREDRKPTMRAERSPNFVVGAGFPHEQNARRRRRPKRSPNFVVGAVSPQSETARRRWSWVPSWLGLSACVVDRTGFYVAGATYRPVLPDAAVEGTGVCVARATYKPVRSAQNTLSTAFVSPWKTAGRRRELSGHPPPS
jgi:hypothetical protein